MNMKSNAIRHFTNEQTSEELPCNESQTIRKAAALIRIPNQRLFGPKAAARYLGICEDTLKKITDLEQIRAFSMNGRRAYRLEDLEQFIESLPGWYDAVGEKSAKVVEKGNHDL
jgi:hypothetical protein